MSEAQPKPIRKSDELDDVLEQPLAVLYKHSPLCGASATAAREVRSFMDQNPEVPVYLIDVIRDRPLAREAARRLSIRHESPQAFVLRDGAVEWSASHRRVTADALEQHVNGDDGGAP